MQYRTDEFYIDIVLPSNHDEESDAADGCMNFKRAYSCRPNAPDHAKEFIALAYRPVRRHGDCGVGRRTSWYLKIGR